jgi:hypothetical protein
LEGFVVGYHWTALPIAYLPSVPSVEMRCRNLSLPFPWRIGLPLLSIRDFVFAGSGMMAQRKYPRQSLQCDTITIRELDFQALPRCIPQVLRPAFDYIWREYAYCCCLNYDKEERYTHRM